MKPELIIRRLGQQLYQPVWDQMQSFTDSRTPETPDEIWLVEHFPVYTQGQAGKSEHILKSSDIPVVHSDRGGQVTYHGPGQLVIYTLLDITRLKMGTRQLVTHLENAVVRCLADYNLTATTQCKAPGVYIEDAKICSIGLRVRRGCSYHGLAFNLDMDLGPFSWINPCGYQGLRITQLKEHIGSVNRVEITTKMIQYLAAELGYELTTAATTEGHL